MALKCILLKICHNIEFLTYTIGLLALTYLKNEIDTDQQSEIKKSKIDLIISDINMPLINGYKLTS